MPGKHAAKARQHSDEKVHDGPMSTQSACRVR